MPGATTIMDSGPAEVSSPDEIEGGSALAFNKLVAHSQLRLAEARDDERRARQMEKQLQQYRKHVLASNSRGRGQFGAQTQLRKDEWIRINNTLTAVARDNTLGIQTLRERGIEVPLDLGATRFEWEDVDDLSDANVDMGATSSGGEDSLSFTNNGIPLPLAHKSFKINLRKLRSSRNRGQPIDTSGVEAATAAVARKLEDVLYGGNSITVAGDSVSGLTDFTDRETVNGNATWDGATADNMIDDIMRTVEALEDAKALPGQSGYDTFIARTNYQEIRATNSGTDDKKGVLQQIRERMEQEEDLPSSVRFWPVDRLSEGNGVMVKPTERYMQLPAAADIQTVQWESQGGMVQHWKVFGSVMPALRSDPSNNSGVAHLSSI